MTTHPFVLITVQVDENTKRQQQIAILNTNYEKAAASYVALMQKLFTAQIPSTSTPMTTQETILLCQSYEIDPPKHNMAIIAPAHAIFGPQETS